MDIQLLVAGLIGLAALFFLIRRFYRQSQGKGEAGCEKCDMKKSDY